MVDFTLTEEQENIREMAHDFAEKEIRPVAWEYDKDGTWPEEIIKKAWELGLMNSHLPERVRRRGRFLPRRLPDRRGAGLGLRRDRDDARRQRSGRDPGVARRFGSRSRASYLGRLTRGAEAGVVLPDRAGRRLRRVRHAHDRREEGDKYVINGSKCFITNGGYADWYTVYAKTDKDAGHRGISAFVVPKDETVTVDKHEDKMGLRASNTATISFNETEVPAGNLLGEENHGFKLAMMTLDRTRPGVASMATGIARAAFEFASDYSKERVQFGVPIAMHQAIQFMIADMATKHRGRAPADVAVGRAARPGPAQHARLLARQALRRRLGHGDHRRCRAGVRRLRLHEGVPGREADARREDHAALRGHVTDPAPRHRARGPPAPPGTGGRLGQPASPHGLARQTE